MINPVLLVTAVAALVGFGGLVYGVTGKAEARRLLGLRLCQGGMAVAGLAMIGGGLMSPDKTDAIYGLLLLVFATGITAIGPKRSGPTRNA